ncbi:unnamed protein product [Camellia sinensis]
MENYDLERFVDANVELSSVMDAATTCEDGFKEKRGVVSPLTKRNGDTFEVSAMALSIMAQRSLLGLTTVANRSQRRSSSANQSYWNPDCVPL